MARPIWRSPPRPSTGWSRFFVDLDAPLRAVRVAPGEVRIEGDLWIEPDAADLLDQYALASGTDRLLRDFDRARFTAAQGAGSGDPLIRYRFEDTVRAADDATWLRLEIEDTGPSSDRRTWTLPIEPRR